MGLDDVFHVVCDGNPIQHAMTYRQAWDYANLLGTEGDKRTAGTKTRTSEFRIGRCLCVLKEEDALYKEARRRTLVVRP